MQTNANPQDGRLSPEQCHEMIAKGVRVLDVRSAAEYAEGHLPQAVNVPLDTLDTWLKQQPNKQEPFVLYCGAGMRAQKGCDILRANGFDCVLNGGAFKELVCCQPE